MNRALAAALPTLAIALSACSTSATPTALPTIVLDSTSRGESSSTGNVSASAVVVPVHKVSLSFPLTGTVKTVQVAVGDLVKAGEPLVTLDTVILEARVSEAQANVAAAETQLNYLIRQGEDEVHLQSARAEIDQAQAALDGAAAALAQATLLAPFGGTIAALDTAPAETVIPGQVVIVMGDLTAFQIETTDLSERDVPAVERGQPATIFIEALNLEMSGKVVEVARVSESLGGDVVYRVTLELDEQADGLRWGMSAEVQINTGT